MLHKQMREVVKTVGLLKTILSYSAQKRHTLEGRIFDRFTVINCKSIGF